MQRHGGKQARELEVAEKQMQGSWSSCGAGGRRLIKMSICMEKRLNRCITVNPVNSQSKTGRSKERIAYYLPEDPASGD